MRHPLDPNTRLIGAWLYRWNPELERWEFWLTVSGAWKSSFDLRFDNEITGGEKLSHWGRYLAPWSWTWTEPVVEWGGAQ
jgi:hypothetical protein